MTYEEYKRTQAERDARRKAEQEAADKEFKKIIERMDEDTATIQKCIEKLKKTFRN